MDDIADVSLVEVCVCVMKIEDEGPEEPPATIE